MIDEKKVQKIKSRFAAWFASSALCNCEEINYYEKYNCISQSYCFYVTVENWSIFPCILLQYLVHLARINRVPFYMTTVGECLAFVMH